MLVDNFNTAKEYAVLLIGDCYNPAHSNILDNILDCSKGCLLADETVTIYRIYFATASYFTTFRERDGAIKATGTDGVEWESPDMRITRLLEQQKALDKQLGCIPDGYLADDLLYPDLHCISATIV